ncbi:MAG: efflux RND transporter permease subunit [Candidatus Rokubacteria bacterium]|nr:efflux RND transporter permease subunit [Candidatus Rokubacteria bacterium]
MKLIEFCVRYPVTVLVGVILALLFGGISLLRLPLQMIPTVDRPEITVETDYSGAAPLEVEQEVVDRQEEKLNAVENLREITSSSIEGKGRIVLSFDWGVNKDVARLEVSEKLDQVRDVPVEAKRPVIRAVNTDEESPIAWIIVETGRDLNEVWEEVEDVIAPRLERVEGVGAVWRFGGQAREVHVLLDLAALTARGISVAEVHEAIVRENRNIKGGSLEEGKRRYAVRTLGQFTDLGQLERIIVRQDRGNPVYLADIARVRFGHEDRDFAVRQMGKPALGLGVLRRTGANTLEVMKGVEEAIAYLNQTYRDKGIRLIQVYDETDYLHDSVRQVTTNVYYGVALAVAALLLFLRSPSSVLIIATTIPIALVTTFVFLAALGRSLNIITLAGLAFAAGMVVDNAVVVLENIFRQRELGKGKMRAALDGAREVWGAILASSLTTIAVFVPVLFVQQEAGQLFRDIAIAISFAVALSLLVALTVIPMLSARLLAVNRRAGPRWLARPSAALDRFGAGFVAAVVGLLAWLRRGLLRRLATATGIVALALAASYLLAPPIDYLPQGNRNLIFVVVRTPPGFNTDQKEAIIKELERRFMDIPGIQRLFGVVRIEAPIMGALVKPEHADLLGMRRVLAEMRRLAVGVPGPQAVFITQSPLFRRRGAFFGGTNIDIDVKGADLETIRRTAETIEAGLRGLPELNFVNTSFEWGNPELQVMVDRDRAAALGLSVSEVGEVVETLVGGTLAGAFRERGKERDIRLRSSADRALRTQDLAETVLFTRAGRPIKLADIAEVRPELGPTKVEHVDLDRAIKLTANIRDEVPLEAAVRLVESRVVDPVRQTLPLGYAINVTGHAKDLVEAWNALKWSFLLALVVIYLLMASLFESWATPLVILFTVPLAATGGVLAVRLAHLTEPTIKMDSVTMLGFIILAGIVVNNAILIVHQALNFMQAGRPAQEAILESVRTRIRPIFITTTTTVLGMLPLVVARGAGSELYRGLGSAVLGGLTLSTLFTLVLIPVVYSLWLDAREALTARARRRAEIPPLAAPK